MKFGKAKLSRLLGDAFNWKIVKCKTDICCLKISRLKIKAPEQTFLAPKLEKQTNDVTKVKHSILVKRVNIEPN